MFGRGKTGMTENQKFIMAKGRQVGNLTSASKAAAKSGKLPTPVVGPGAKGRQNLGALGKVSVPLETLPMRSRK